MAKYPVHQADSFEENTGGFLAGLLADESDFDQRALWRLGSWGVAAIGTVVIALLANHSSLRSRNEQLASVDLARQSQAIQQVSSESQSQARRLASAIETLNGDRDRLFSRVTVLEQGLDSVTGTIAKQKAAQPPQAVPATPADPQPTALNQPTPIPAPVTTATATPAPPVEKPQISVASPEPSAVTPAPPPTDPVATTTSAAKNPSDSPAQAASPPTPAANTPTPAMPLMASKSMLGPPDPAAGTLVQPETTGGAAPSAPTPDVVASTSNDAAPNPSTGAPASVSVKRTEFAVDVGGANSVGGLRALWRGLLKSKSNAALAELHPIVMVKEGSNGLGLQLRLAAGPLNDAAAAAKICATLLESERPCETTVFDGQRLAMKADDASTTTKSARPPVMVRQRNVARRAAATEEPPKKPEGSTLSSFFGWR